MSRQKPHRPTYVEANWERLNPAFRAAHNKLRQARGLEPIPEPAVDQYFKPKQTPLRPFDPNDPELVASALEFHGLDDEAEAWKTIAKRLALEMADKKLAAPGASALKKNEKYRAIASFFAVAEQESGWVRKRIIAEAMRLFDVKERTVENALAQELAEVRRLFEQGK